MAENTAITWTDHTFNIAWGCQRVSHECTHCYAETLAIRFGKRNLWGPPATSIRTTRSDAYWSEPLRWNRRAEREGRRHRVFSSSTCDVFEDHPTITREREKLWDLIRRTPHLDWLLLTKRDHRISA